MSRQRFSYGNVIVVVSALLLIVLIGLVTVVASSLITTTVSEQFRSQETQLVGTLARQIEFLFDTLGGDLLNLAAQPTVQSITYVQREQGLAALAALAERRAGSIRSIVRLNDNGAARYAWPPELNTRIRNGEQLDWSLSSSAVRGLIEADALLFRPVPARGELVFLLVAPVRATSGHTELLVAEVNLQEWFASNLGLIELGETGQLWVLDGNGRLLYEARQDAFNWGDNDLSLPLLVAATEPSVLDYDAPDGLRQAAFAPAQSYNVAFFPIISRLVSESQQDVRRQVNLLFGMTLLAVLLVGGLAWAFMRRILGETRRREQEEQRRQVARSLLDVSRAVNSTLDLKTVLNRVLSGLVGLLDHDSASILLRTEDGLAVAAASVAAQEVDRSGEVYSWDDARAAGEVVETGQPILMRDVLADPRWQPLPDSPIRSWLGVPLRVEDETVGVLNINKFELFGFQEEDVEVALAFADQAGVAITNARLHEFQIERYEQELKNAHDIQTSLLPDPALTLPELEVIGHSRPAQVVSGDFYQYLPRLDGRLGVAIGDVTGKGMPAALLMAVLTTALRREFERQGTLAELFDHLNETLTERMQSRHMQGALAMGVFDPATRRVKVANAGMVQPYLRTPEGQWDLVPVGGYPLGASLQRRYTDKTVTLAPGALLLFMSDGIIEAQNPDGEFYGFERIEALLASLPVALDGEAIIARILAAVDEHLAGQEAQDDITLVVLRSLEVPVSLKDQDDELTLPARPAGMVAPAETGNGHEAQPEPSPAAVAGTDDSSPIAPDVAEEEDA